MKIGVVDVGGGLRGIYAAGVFDYCMEKGINFDLCIGVSAGSANVASYLSGQRERNKQFYCEYAFRKQYMSIGNFLRTGSYIDMDYVYGTLCNTGGENPYDYAAFEKTDNELYVVATNAVTGEAKYFDRSDISLDNYQVLMASSSIPGVNKPYVIGGVPYFDGALGDPVPVKKAFDEGCDRVVLILTKPVGIPRTAGKDPGLARMIRRKYPKSAEMLSGRAERYNSSVELAKQYEKEGKVCIISPENTEGVTTLSRDIESLERLYQRGMRDAEKIRQWL